MSTAAAFECRVHTIHHLSLKRVSQGPSIADSTLCCPNASGNLIHHIHAHVLCCACVCNALATVQRHLLDKQGYRKCCKLSWCTVVVWTVSLLPQADFMPSITHAVMQLTCTPACIIGFCHAGPESEDLSRQPSSLVDGFENFDDNGSDGGFPGKSPRISETSEPAA